MRISGASSMPWPTHGLSVSLSTVSRTSASCASLQNGSRSALSRMDAEHEARTFLDELKERMRKFELALHPDKTRLIRFGRHAAKQREKLGEGKPETFDFLGFTHFCTRSRKWGSFVIGRKTIKKRMRAKLL